MKTLEVSSGQVPGLLNRRNWDTALQMRTTRRETVSLVWFSSTYLGLPHAIVIEDERFVEIASLLTTHSESLSPLTSYVRLIPKAEFAALKERIESHNVSLRNISSCVGITVAEALLQRGLADSPADVPLSACLKTLSWTLGRLYLQCENGAYVDVAARWSAVWDLLRDDELNVQAPEVLEVWSSLFESSDGSKLRLGLLSEGALVFDIVKRSGTNIEEIWSDLASVSSIAKSFRLTERQSREERYSILGGAFNELAVTGRLAEPMGRAILGVYAAACVDFSLAAVTLLPAAAPKAARLWAGLFAGVAKAASPGQESSPLESRLECLFESGAVTPARTTADISFEELMMLRRVGTVRMNDLRLTSATEVAVEMVSGLVSTFSANGKRLARRREPVRPRERELGEVLLQLERASELLRRAISAE